MNCVIWFLLCIFNYGHGYSHAIHETEIVMRKLGVVPEIISVSPQIFMEILYPTGAIAKTGNELTPSQVNDIPLIYWKADAEQFYTVIMLAPDSPTRDNPIYGNIVHWLIVNVPGHRVEEGQTVCEYLGSIPPPDTGMHRYLFLVYKQKNRINYTEDYIPYNNYSGRKFFSLVKLVRKYYLSDPIAGNLFFAQFDDFVLKIREQFSI